MVEDGNGGGNRLAQLSDLQFVFADQDYSVCMSDSGNDRAMKWVEGGTQGSVIIGGGGEGGQ